MSTDSLVPLKEAARRLGFRHESSLYRLRDQGLVEFVSQPHGKRNRSFLKESDIERLRVDGYARGSGDPVDEALSRVEAELASLRLALRERDEQVRRAAIEQLADALKEGLRR